ncbi:MAG: DNA mismatch repair endonuclease MutL [Bacteroidetes bacterium]|nr:MAG: DNA mismatch repair endonuclease MutL [Bacteroidota bacterium]
MPDSIQLLPDSIANQIAAGEVVQRPASAVKELVENAIDAGATEITVIVKEAGKALIQVIDNGAGMSETDARMSFERHATSKIRKTEDLFTILTMGFRGEALASIAAVAQVEMSSRQEEAELGTLLKIEGSEVKVQEPASCPKGTSVAVKNLFYNIPARRNFLKSNAVEMRHITDEFTRIALANPQVSFSLYQNDLETYNLLSSKLSQRIIGLFGAGYKEQMVKCEEETNHIIVKGYLGKPESAKKTRGEQFFFVNNRFIKSGYLHHAVLNAFEGLLAPETHPFYVLYIDIDPKHVDVNVHPTKTEIKFDDERTVYGVIRAAVRQALATHNVMPSIDFANDINFGQFRTTEAPVTDSDTAYTQFRNIPKDRNLDNWESLYGDQIKQSKLNYDVDNGTQEESTIHKESAINNPQEEIAALDGNTFQVQGNYIISPIKSGLLLVDQEAAHERILYERFVGQLANRSGNAQQCMFPQNIELNPGDFSLVMELQDEISALGFLFEEFGSHSIVINAMPAGLPANNEKELFEGLIEQFKRNKSELSISIPDNLARAMAKRSSLKEGQQLNNQECKSIIDSLFACENPNYAPDGSKTFFILDLKRIENLFS